MCSDSEVYGLKKHGLTRSGCIRDPRIPRERALIYWQGRNLIKTNIIITLTVANHSVANPHGIFVALTHIFGHGPKTHGSRMILNTRGFGDK